MRAALTACGRMLCLSALDVPLEFGKRIDSICICACPVEVLLHRSALDGLHGTRVPVAGRPQPLLHQRRGEAHGSCGVLVEKRARPFGVASVPREHVPGLACATARQYLPRALEHFTRTIGAGGAR
jgi:hypothetical protein